MNATHALGLVVPSMKRKLPIAFSIAKAMNPNIENALAQKALDIWPNVKIILPCAENCDCSICRLEGWADPQ